MLQNERERLRETAADEASSGDVSAALTDTSENWACKISVSINPAVCTAVITSGRMLPLMSWPVEDCYNWIYCQCVLALSGFLLLSQYYTHCQNTCQIFPISERRLLCRHRISSSRAQRMTLCRPCPEIAIPIMQYIQSSLILHIADKKCVDAP